MQGVGAGTSGLLFNTMQSKKVPFQLSEYMGKVNTAIQTRKSRLRLIKCYTGMMKGVFDAIMKVIRNPIYFFDVAIVMYWLPRLDFILQAILKVLKGFSRVFGGNRRVLNIRQHHPPHGGAAAVIAADNELNNGIGHLLLQQRQQNQQQHRAARRIALNHLILLH